MKRSAVVVTKEAGSSNDPKKSKPGLLEEFLKEREKTANSILEFEFKKKRVRVLSKATDVAENKKGTNNIIFEII